MKKRKKGSSLMMVVIVFSILMIFNFSILSLTVASYKKRTVDSSEKRNQYFSESGLDIAYGIIGEVVDAAVKKGNDAVEEYMNNSLNTDESIQDENGDIDETKLRRKQNSIFRTNYKNYVLKSIRKGEEQDNVIEEGIKDDEIPSGRQDNYNIDGNRPEVKVINDESLDFDDNGELKLQLQADFVKNEVEKKIKVNYNIKTPNYNDSYYVETNKVEIPKIISEKAIYADGDLNIEGNITVDGNIYIKGNENSESGGINIKYNNCRAIFKKEVVTGGDFKIMQPKGKVEVYENIYAGNLSIDEAAVESKFTSIGDVYLNNDLELNGEKSVVDINGALYGLGDINEVKDGDGNVMGDLKQEKKPKSSSCILVNEEDIGMENGSSIKIGKETLLMGTAYIKNNTAFYQTGESVAIKGNYIAYGYGLDTNHEQIQKRIKEGKQSLGEENMVFEYLDPLTLVTSFENGETLTWQDKSDYFTIYSSQYKEDNGLNLGSKGLDFTGEVNHIGAIVSGGKVDTGNYTLDKQDFVVEKIKAYKNMLYKDADKDLKTTSDIVDFTNIGDKTLSESGTDKIYLGNEDCVLEGKNSSNIDTVSKKITLDNGVGKGIIITKGNVYISGDVNFTGTIIAGGSIIVEQGSKVTIINDKNYLKKVIRNNYGLFKDIFVLDENQDKDVITIELNVDKAKVETDIIRDKLITMEQWRIVK